MGNESDDVREFRQGNTKSHWRRGRVQLEDRRVGEIQANVAIAHQNVLFLRATRCVRFLVGFALFLCIFIVIYIVFSWVYVTCIYGICTCTILSTVRFCTRSRGICFVCFRRQLRNHDSMISSTIMRSCIHSCGGCVAWRCWLGGLTAILSSCWLSRSFFISLSFFMVAETGAVLLPRLLEFISSILMSHSFGVRLTLMNSFQRRFESCACKFLYPFPQVSPNLAKSLDSRQFWEETRINLFFASFETSVVQWYHSCSPEWPRTTPWNCQDVKKSIT